MDNDNVKNEICGLFTWCIGSLIIVLIAVIYRLMGDVTAPVGYKIFSISNLCAWLVVLYKMSGIECNSSILIRITYIISDCWYSFFFNKNSVKLIIFLISCDIACKLFILFMGVF